LYPSHEFGRSRVLPSLPLTEASTTHLAVVGLALFQGADRSVASELAGV